MAASLVGLKHSGDVSLEDGKATLSSPAARLQMSGHALLLLCGQTSNVWACISVTPRPDFKCPGVHCCYSAARFHSAVTLWSDFKCPGVHCCYSVARLQMAGHALLLLHGQAHWSPGRYSIHFCGRKLNLTKIDLSFVKALMS